MENEIKPKNVKVIKKPKKSIKYRLKRFGICATSLAVVSASVFIANKVFRDITVPQDFNFKGTSYSSFNNAFNVDDEEDIAFNMIEVTGWEEGKNESVLKKIENCRAKGLPCSLTLSTEALTPVDIRTDASVVIASIRGIDIDYPIFLNIDKIAAQLDQAQLLTVIKNYFEIFNEQENKYFVGISGTKESLAMIGDDFNDITKMVICPDKIIGYDGSYELCYFERTDEYYSKYDYKKIIERKFLNNNTEDTITLPEETGIATEYLKGIDVSYAQSEVDWDKLGNNIDFAIIRLCSFESLNGSGNFNEDVQFRRNLEGCQRNNIPFGIYVYNGAKTTEQAVEEAKRTAQCLKGINLNLPVYLDIEDYYLDETKFYETNPELTGNICKAFFAEMESQGYEASRLGIYTTRAIIRVITKEHPDLKEREKWIAGYWIDKDVAYEEINNDYIFPEVENVGAYNMIQISRKARIDGINNAVDVNYILDQSIIKYNQTNITY